MENRFVQLILQIVIACALSGVLMWRLLPLLRRLKAGQSIREDGPQAHLAKAGTPTMGGISIVGGFIIALVISMAVMAVPSGCKPSDIADPSSFKPVLMIIFVTLAYAGIGFFDDYIKVVKKRNLGLTAKQKLALQIVVAVALAVYAGSQSTVVYVPFFKTNVDFGWFYYVFVVFVVVAMTNAVNLTDGLDGLASSVTAVVSLCFALLCNQLFQVQAYRAAACLCGACLGFLIFNHYPAKVFMGDTGSLALGGALSAIAIVCRLEFVLPIAGLLYVLEALSVIIQVFVFKTQNGRRFFRMAPLHHHFELGGWKETKVVTVFVAFTAFFSLLAVLFA